MAESAEENKYKCNKKPTGIDYWNACVLTITMGAVIVYACLTHSLLKTSQKQLQYSQRAWVGISDNFVALTKPIFEYGEIKTDVSFAVQNFSDSTVIKEFDGAIAFVPLDQTRKPELPGASVLDTSPNSPCGSEQSRTDITGALVSSGDAIFPHSKLNRVYHSTTAMPPGMKSFNYVWVIVCIGYRDQTDTQRHTRLWYRSGFKEGAQAIQDGPFTHMPFESLELWDTQAD